MSTYKNVEIARDFNVSNTAVTNWIEATLQGKNNLQLEIVKGKHKILKNEHNRSEMLILSEQGKIYKNKGSFAQVSPRPEFYKIFSEDQIIDLINNIEVHKVIPLKFTFLSQGAKMWNDYTNFARESNSYMPDIQNPILLKNISYNLLERIKLYDNVNIFDFGTGNSYSMKTILDVFDSAKKKYRYFGIDISKEMLEISKQSIIARNKDTEYVEYVADIENMNVSKLLFTYKNKKTVNLLFFIGSTIGNMENGRRVLENFRYSMNNEDLFILSNKIEKENYKADFSNRNDLREKAVWIPRILGIDIDQCENVNRYDDKIRSRTSSLVMDKDYEIKFVVNGVERIVNLYKGEYLENWFHHMSTKNELISDLDYAGFELLDLTTTKEISHILTVCKAKV